MPTEPEECDHGVVFDQAAAEKILAGWTATDDVSFIMGDPAVLEVRKRWPRGWFTAEKPCPKGCGYVGIYYASVEHYTMGYW